jgi:SH3-like domain-containing protein
MYKPINLYQDPDAHSEVAGTLEPGVIVPVIEMSEDGLWLKVGFDPVGWVSVAQVALTGSMYTKPDTASKRQGVIQSDTAVNVRSGPGTTFRVLGQIKAGQVVVTLDQSTDGQWVQVQFKGGDGWVAVSTVIMAGGEPTLTPVVTEETTREP